MSLDRDINLLKRPDYPVIQYNNYCKVLIFIEDNKVTVEVNQKFARKFISNFTIAPNCWKDFPTIQSKDEEIELIETRTFYPYSRDVCGGDDHRIFVFKANQKGNFKIKFSDCTMEVKVI